LPSERTGAAIVEAGESSVGVCYLDAIERRSWDADRHALELASVLGFQAGSRGRKKKVGFFSAVDRKINEQ
jgi:ribosome modulation factor